MADQHGFQPPPQGFQPPPQGFPHPPQGFQPGFQPPPQGFQMQGFPHPPPGVAGGPPPQPFPHPGPPGSAPQPFPHPGPPGSAPLPFPPPGAAGGPPPQPFPHPPPGAAGGPPQAFPHPGPPGSAPQPFPHPGVAGGPPPQPFPHPQQPQPGLPPAGTPGAPAVGLPPSGDEIRAGFARIRTGAADAKVAASSSGLGHHSYSPTEVKSFTEFTNQALAGDQDLNVLPINPDSEDLFEASRSGVLLCKLLHSINPGAIDMKQVSLHPRNKFEALINHRVFLAAAKSLGFVIVNIGPEDLYSGEKNYLTHALFWQTIRYALLSRVNITSHPEIAQLMREGETTDDFAKLPAEENLIRWVNFHLARSSCPRRISNFGRDIVDSEVYIHLLNQLSPGSCTLEALAIPDPAARAEGMLQGADRLGCRKFVTPNDVVAGNEKLNLAFVATLFHEHPGIAPPSAEDEVQRVREIEGAVRHKLQAEEEEFRRRLEEEQRQFREAMEKERAAMQRQMEEALRSQEEERNKALEDQAKRLNSEWKKVEEEREKLEHERLKQTQHMQQEYAGMSIAAPLPLPPQPQLQPQLQPPMVGGYPTSGYPPPPMPSMIPGQMAPPMVPGQLPMPPMMPGQMPVGYGAPGYPAGYPADYGMQATMYSTWYPTYYQQVGAVPTVIHIFKK